MSIAIVDGRSRGYSADLALRLGLLVKPFFAFILIQRFERTPA
jgi:hypothetical protein